MPPIWLPGLWPTLRSTARRIYRCIQSSPNHVTSSSNFIRETNGVHHQHYHERQPISNVKGHDLGILGVLIHLIGDAINNVGVIVAALVIWFTTFDGRFYADPGVSMGIALLILLSSVPLGICYFMISALANALFLVRNSGRILLESAPRNVNITQVQRDLEMV